MEKGDEIPSLAAHATALGELGKEEALRMFDIGATINKSTSGWARQKYAKLFSLSLYHVNLACKLAEQYDNDIDRFANDYDTGAGSWQSMVILKTKPKRKPEKDAVIARHVNSIAKYMRLFLDGKFQDDKSDVIYANLKKLQRELNNYLPIVEGLADKNYMRYAMCVYCGAHPTNPDGLALVRSPQYQFMQYPVCPTCASKKQRSEPRWKEIAFLYMSYARMVEHFAESLDV